MANKLFTKENIQRLVKGLALIAVGVLVGGTVSLTVTTNSDGNTVVELQTEIVESGTIELADTQVEATIVDESGEEVVDTDIVTVEEVDGGEIDTECEDKDECARGWAVDTSSPQAFRAAVEGDCIDVDGYYGSQCPDLAKLFWRNYANRDFSTCGTGAAKGAWTCKEANAGDEFELITDPTELQPGDWIIFSSGTYGHVGMAMGYYNNGYITLLGTNQGGSSCSGGGATANVINISLSSFTGAYRPKAYVVEEPVEDNTTTEEESTTTAINTCDSWTVKAGDTLGGIMVACLGSVDWSDWDSINAYADKWISSVWRDGQSVYEGWATWPGVGLRAGDVIIFNE